MTKFTVDITDDDQLAGITVARLQRNAGMPQVIKDENGEEGETIPNPDLLDTDDEYVAFVLKAAADSYAIQYKVAETRVAQVKADSIKTVIDKAAVAKIPGAVELKAALEDEQNQAKA